MKLNLLRQKCNNLLQRFIRLFSLTSVAFVVTACYGSPYAEYDVEGYVYDENGNMLENMQVVVRTFDAQWDYPDTVYTNQDGHYHAVHSLTSTSGDCMEVIVHDTTGVYASDSTHISSG
ncbi:MAG: radical SAM-associated putative lipoprotein, partial [Paludibacteraceae bacterium]|nr:radical SAM-associated putative lipoprotein [Paludibacteraceae bacterium]